ncbi:inositol-1-monophosphatase [Escherichia coli]|nr:inositol-1-monophosphatase [Escherichia coli]
MHPMLNIAVRAARKAGNLIAKNYETPDAVEASQKGSNDFVTNVDKAAEAVIIDTIRKSYPQHTIITEESGELEVLIRMFNGLSIHWMHYQLYQTSAALRGIYRRSYQRPHRSCCGIRSYA